MKLKKFVSGLVALALAATMAAPALAAAPSVPDKNNLFEIKTTIIGGTGFDKEKIKLELEDDGKPFQVENSSLTVADAASLKISIPAAEKEGVEIVQAADGKTTAEGMLHIQLPTYDRVGVYTYKFKVADGGSAGMMYNTGTKYLKVFVYESVDENGNLKANSSLNVKAVVLGSNAEENNEVTLEEAEKLDEITNRYFIHKLKATKQVKGNAGDRKKEFSFKVTLIKPADKSINGIILKKGPDDSSYTELKASNFTVDPTDSTKLTYTFNLKDDQTMEFAQIPYDVKIKVVELDAQGNEITTPGADGKYMNGEYEVTYDEFGNVENQINRNTCIINTTITNKSTMNPDTGIILDNAPYIALLTIVAAGTVMMLIKKRRIED